MPSEKSAGVMIAFLPTTVSLEVSAMPVNSPRSAPTITTRGLPFALAARTPFWAVQYGTSAEPGSGAVSEQVAVPLEPTWTVSASEAQRPSRWYMHTAGGTAAHCSSLAQATQVLLAPSQIGRVA